MLCCNSLHPKYDQKCTCCPKNKRKGLIWIKQTSDAWEIRELIKPFHQKCQSNPVPLDHIRQTVIHSKTNFNIKRGKLINKNYHDHSARSSSTSSSKSSSSSSNRHDLDARNLLEAFIRCYIEDFITLKPSNTMLILTLIDSRLLCGIVPK